MTRRTPPRPVDLAAVAPELAGFSRTTTRLHPRRGEPTVTTSSIGGPLRWPADEPWPVCSTEYQVSWSEMAGHEPPNPLLPIAQLYAADVPTIPFPVRPAEAAHGG